MFHVETQMRLIKLKENIMILMKNLLIQTENGTDSDHSDYLTNLINISDINENIENTKEGDK